MEKKCSRCFEVKPLEQFFNRKDRKIGKTPQCKDCEKNRTKGYKEKNKEKLYETYKKWAKNNTDKIKVIRDRRILKSRAYARNKSLMKKYGITAEQKNQMVILQDNCCAICHIKFSNSRIICVDHDHVTGKVRSILCTNCNHLIGSAKEDVGILYSAINYIQKWNI